LFKTEDGQSQKPRGQVYEWVESFLLPDTSTDVAAPRRGSAKSVRGGPDERPRLVWMTNVDEAMAKAAKENKPIFFDFTGLG